MEGKSNRYTIVRGGTVPISQVVMDCDVGLCVPTNRNETLASILKKLCARITSSKGTITINAGNNITIDGNATQNLIDNPVYTIHADISQIINNLGDNNTFIDIIEEIVCEMVEDTPTIDLTCDDGVLTADLIVGNVDDSITNFMVWNGTEVHIRNISSITGDVINVFLTQNYYTTSTDCIDIPEIHPTLITMTVGAGLEYVAGQDIIIYYDATHYFTAVVVSYDGLTGQLVVNSTSNVGTGNFCNWTVNLAGLFGLSTVVTEDTPTITLSGTGSLVDPLFADLIVGDENNLLTTFLVWDGMEVHTRTITSFSGDIFNTFNVANYYTASTDCIDIPTTHPTQIIMTVGTDLDYEVGQTVIVYYDATHYFTATVVSYDPLTGLLVIDSVSNVGTGNFCNWTVNLASLFGLSTVVTEDTNTINLSGDGTLPNPLFGDVIVNGINDTVPNLVVWDGDKLWQRELSTIIGDNALVYGGEIEWVSGYTFDVGLPYPGTGAYINGVFYEAPYTQVTLDPADPTYDRFDAIVIDDTGSIVVLTGTPSELPAQPAVDIGSQLLLGFVFVQAGTTEPVIGTDCLYLDNTEWTTFSSSGTIVVNSATTPCSGTVSIEGTNVVNGAYVTLTDVLFYPYVYTTLTFSVKSKGSWGNKSLTFRWYNGSTPVGNPVVLSHNSYGFASATTGVCQNLAIPMVDFGLNSSIQADNLRITANVPSGTFTGFFLDTICITALPISTPPNDLTFHNFLVRSGDDIQFGGVLDHDTFAHTLYNRMYFSGYTVYDYPYQFAQQQSWQNGSSIVSFTHVGETGSNTGSLGPNSVRLGINYFDPVYLDATPGPAVDGPLGGDFGGFAITSNIKLHGSFGLDQDDNTAKNNAIVFHTKDAGTEGISFFSRAAAGGVYVTDFPSTRILTFHTNKIIEVVTLTQNDGLDQLLARDPATGYLYWRDANSITGGGGSAGYLTVQDEGVSLTQRTVINFIGDLVTAVDNAGSSRTDITVATPDLQQVTDVGNITTNDIIQYPAAPALNTNSDSPYFMWQSRGNKVGVEYESEWIIFNDATSDDADSSFRIQHRVYTGAAPAFTDYFAISDIGQITNHFYGDGLFEASPAYFAGWDANGNLVEIDPADVGGGGTLTKIKFQVGDVGYPADQASTYTNAALIGKDITVHLEGELLYEGVDYTFNSGTGAITFTPVLIEDERVEIHYGGSGGTGTQNLFERIQVAGQSDVVADSTTDTLTLVAGTNVTITTNAATDTITINSTGGGGGSPDVITRDVITTTTTLTTSHYYIAADATSGSFSLNLPAASTVTERVYIIKKIDSSANTVTVDPNSTETIDGSTTVVLSQQYQTIWIVSNGSNWEQLI